LPSLSLLYCSSCRAAITVPPSVSATTIRICP
jgi:hypothetical protein